MTLINIVVILRMPATAATPHVLKIKVFWKKGYDVIISDRPKFYPTTQITS